MHLDMVESLKMQYENFNKNLVEQEDSEEKEMHLDELKSVQMQYKNLNINTVEFEDSKEKGGSKENDMKGKKRNSCKFNKKFIWCILVCVDVVCISNLIQVGDLKKDQMELPE
ncbi:hypothetical protein HAX54_009504 [Datura stramonium]|uniref:Uncharacterized protein n=1 Tax=Datura stramonium TaxID=4076 RepID=A0ABS8TGM4_DATST|nr:hypothetical protein [Datura stramonium]